MSQSNLTTSLLDKFQQKIQSLSRTSHPAPQDNSQIMTEHVASSHNEASNKYEQSNEEKMELMKKEQDHENSENENLPVEDDPVRPNSESNECSQNRNAIPIASGYENLYDQESSNYYNELNEKSHEPNIDRDQKFKSQFKEKIGKDNFLEEEGEGNAKESFFPSVYSESRPNFVQQFDRSGDYKKTQEGYNDGRQYGEEWKRNFVIDLLKSLSQLDHTKKNDYIRQMSHQIKVRNYEIKIWLSSYQIIFKIEKRVSKQASSKELLQAIERELFMHVKGNGNERRYIVTKMLGYIVKSFNIQNVKLDAWVKRFVTKYESQFTGFEILKRKRKDADEEVHMHDKTGRMFDKKKRKGEERANYLERGGKRSGHSLFFQKSRQEDVSIYPMSFRQKISNKISEEIKKAVDQILTQKSEQFCLSYGIIKSIFKQHGDIDLQIKQKSNSFSNKISQQFEPGKLNFAKNHVEIPPAPLKKIGDSKKVFFEQKNEKKKIKMANMNDSKETQDPLSDEALLLKLEQKISSFVKLNLNCPASALQKQTQSTMTSLNFNFRLKSKVRSQWLCLFLKKNNLTLDSNRCLKKVESRKGQKGESKNASVSQVKKHQEEQP